MSTASDEKQRLMSLLYSCNVKKERIDALVPVIDNVAWMKAKLDDAREAIKHTSVAIPYDNGGGQKGIRENPLFKGYESLFKSYMAGMTKIIECIPGEAEKVVNVDAPKTVLQIVREKHKPA